MQRKVFVIGILLLLAIMLFAIFSQPGLDDFETEFIEINLLYYTRVLLLTFKKK